MVVLSSSCFEWCPKLSFSPPKPTKKEEIYLSYACCINMDYNQHGRQTYFWKVADSRGRFLSSLTRYIEVAEAAFPFQSYPQHLQKSGQNELGSMGSTGRGLSYDESSSVLKEKNGFCIASSKRYDFSRRLKDCRPSRMFRGVLHAEHSIDCQTKYRPFMSHGTKSRHNVSKSPPLRNP